jgi:hypothetical protein
VDWTERGILQIRGTFLKTIERHFTKNLPHTSNKRCLISIPLLAHEFILNFSGVCVVRIFSFLCNVLWIFVCPFVLFLLAIALSVIQEAVMVVIVW